MPLDLEYKYAAVYIIRYYYLIRLLDIIPVIILTIIINIPLHPRSGYILTAL
jgi:hypothetical protein